ncbi:MAG: HIT domain-containing protein [Candidatus Omnitrophica bacterium]|nr:HIT domain-containing protein [Candidatus Omnitrophota bacterium]MDD5237275.1 HIT domain-containing protein [Candidatus Omnitrophota bacterium]MDD5610377.1 HIT domain-containing protein [Candidatus Omnitrophota bacterium]
MKTDILWAPWRIKYIQGKKKKGCIFCAAVKGKKNFVIIKNKHSFSVLNTFPYNNGHVMVSPNRHESELENLSEKEVLDLFKTLLQTKKLLDKVLKPHGYNVGINLKEVSGAGVAGHLHIHLVPRWKADTNFMPICAETKVISQSLNELYKKLKNAYTKPD